MEYVPVDDALAIAPAQSITADRSTQLADRTKQLVLLRQKSLLDFFACTGVKTKQPKYHLRRSIPYNIDKCSLPRHQGYSILDGFGANRNTAVEELVRHKIIGSRLNPTKTIFSPKDYVGRAVTRRYGINVLKFDRCGALIAVGGSNGILRIYDFDECLAALQRMDSTDTSPKLIDPIVVHDMQRSISDIVWSTICNDTISVSYSFVPDIHRINLNESLNPQLFLVGREGLGGGHNCLLQIKDLPSSTTTQQKLGKNEKTIAGSANGYIRLWDRIINSKRCSWEVYGDPSSSSSKAVAIVGLSLLQNGEIKGIFLSVNAESVFVVWDYVNLISATFGSHGVPGSLKRFALWESISTLPSLVGISAISKDCPDSVLVTYSSGNVYVVNIQKGSIEDSDAKRPIKQQVMASESNGETVGVERPASINSSVMRGCSTLCLSSFGQFVIILSIDTKLHQSAFAHHHQRSSVNPENFISYRKSIEAGLTLPGYIVAAETGVSEIIVSRELHRYLVSHRISAITPSRSSELYFNWNFASIDTQNLHPLFDPTRTQCRSTVENISGFEIILNEPYLGPTVAQGQPRVLLRTNLIMAPSEIENQLLFGRRKQEWGSGEMVRTINIRPATPVTCLTSHPSLPYAIVGFHDHQLSILSPDFGISVKSELLRKDRVTEVADY